MTIRARAAALVAAGACLACLATGARAQSFDHLKCYKAKDPAAKKTYTATLTGLSAESGCIIKVPGKMLCVQTAKSAVSPAPPGGGPSGTDAGAFMCYKVKCPKGAVAPVSVTDQFASRSLAPSSAKFVCAPADVPLPTTTSTLLPPTTLPPTTLPPTTLPPTTLP